MGAIKESKLANGNVGLEITYGGKEAPFGGVDSSAPPAYIDPRCFTDCDGFIVVDNKLVAVSLNPFPTPTLWSGTAGVQLIGFGNFYNPVYGTLNYALGYTAVAVAGTPTGVTYTFYMTSWVPNSLATVYNDTLVTTLYNSPTPAVAASITMQLQTTSSSTPGSGATVTIPSTATSGPWWSNEDITDSQAGGYYVSGILSTVYVTGGTNYKVGTTYIVQQGSNVSGQLTITGVDPSTGAVTSNVLVPSYTTTYVGNSRVASNISFCGLNYEAGSATLVYAESSNVVLTINGVTDSNTYTVTSNGVSQVAPSLAGQTTFLGIQTVCVNGIFYSTGTQGVPIETNISSFSNASIIALVSGDFLGLGGLNYNVGEIYQMVSVIAGEVGGFAIAPFNTIDSGVQIMITGISAGGVITSAQLIGTGLQDSYIPGIYNSDTGLYDYYVAVGPPAPIAVLETGPSYILNTMAAEINGVAAAPYNVANPDVTASVNIASSSLTLTAIVPGSQGNRITVLDTSTISGPNLYYYYFPVRTPPGTPLTGGNDGTSSGTVLQTVLPAQASIAAVGGVLYIANIGPLIIKYEQPGEFVISTTYQGVQVLRKFAGSLIGLGLIPAPGTVVTAANMIFAWSATDDLDIWNPLDLNSDVTGAGFAQLADVGDYLSGLIVTGGTAFILRAQGISYATATGNATNPFSFAHIGLGDQGEGSQFGQLSCQYDQAGIFIGNSEIYQVSSSITPVGTKIKQLLYEAILNNTFRFASSSACTIYVEDEFPAVVFLVGNAIYLYNAPCNAWQTLTINAALNANSSLSAGVFASKNVSLNAGVYNQANSIVALGQSNVYSFYSIYDGLAGATSLTTGSVVVFPVEEIAIGRDVTIDSIYVAIVATLSVAISLAFSINNVLYSTLTLTPAVMNTGTVYPVEFQVFPSSGIPFTGHSPQLMIQIPVSASTMPSEVYLTKIVMFGSFDPNQRPV